MRHLGLIQLLALGIIWFSGAGLYALLQPNTIKNFAYLGLNNINAVFGLRLKAKANRIGRVNHARQASVRMEDCSF